MAYTIPPGSSSDPIWNFHFAGIKSMKFIFDNIYILVFKMLLQAKHIQTFSPC